MLRFVIRSHVLVMLAGTSVIFFAPGIVAGALGLPMSNEIHSMLRVMSCLFSLLAAASFSLSALPRTALAPALTAIGLAYAATSLMVLAQHIAIWGGSLGGLLAAICASQAAAFLWLAYRERPTPAAQG
jgi:hypothetical protein